MNCNVKELIGLYGVKPSKSLGQNFLIDGNIIRRITEAAEVGVGDMVVEVGAGIGNMTRMLAEKAGIVAAIEIDRRLLPALEKNLEGLRNVYIINEDVLKLDIRNRIFSKRAHASISGGPLQIKVVSNLPYYITSPVIMKLLEELPEAGLLVLMVQKEVADRIAAKPGSKDYGALSVAVQYYCTPEKVFDVPPHCFIPQPKVDSAVVRLTPNRNQSVGIKSREVFFKTVKAAFGQRRKTLANALFNSGYFKITKEEIINILANMGIDEKQRGETLSIRQFAELSNVLSKHRNLQIS